MVDCFFAGDGTKLALMVPVSPLIPEKCLEYLNLTCSDLSFPKEFGILAVQGEPNYQRDGWLVGLVNAAPYIASGLWYVQSTCCLCSVLIPIFL